LLLREPLLSTLAAKETAQCQFYHTGSTALPITTALQLLLVTTTTTPRQQSDKANNSQFGKEICCCRIALFLYAYPSALSHTAAIEWVTLQAAKFA
jgi:hypothetical protein